MPRRDFLRSVGATVGSLALPALLVPELRAAPSNPRMKLGLATNGFNSLTNDAFDALSKQPEYKICAVKLEKA